VALLAVYDEAAISLTLAAVLFIPLAAIVIIFLLLRGRAIGLIGPVFVVVAVVYHGLTEVVQALSPFENLYDPYASQRLVTRQRNCRMDH
jgi:fatty acid desaturase